MPNEAKHPTSLDSMSDEEILNDPTMIDPDAGSLEPRFDFSEDMQRNLLAEILTNTESLEVAAELIEPRSFEVKGADFLAQQAIEFFKKYAAAPTKDYLLDAVTREFANNKALAYFQGMVRTIYDYHRCELPSAYWREVITDFAIKAALRKAFHKFLKAIEAKKAPLEAHEEYLLEVDRIKSLKMSDNQLKSLNIIEFLERAEEQSNNWIVDNWIAEKCLHLWVGPKKLGKTSTLTSLVPSLMDGSRWFGKIQVQRCPVVMVDFENPEFYVAENLLLYASREKLKENIERFGAPDPDERPKAISKDFLKRYIENTFPDEETGVLIIDAAVAAFQARFGNCPDWDNKASEVRKVLHELLEVARETNWAIVLVHHANKQGDTGGSVHWEAAVDFVLSFDQHKSDRKLEAKWGRWVQDKPERLVFRKTNGCIELVDTRDDAEGAEQSERDQVLEAIPVIGMDETPTEENAIGLEDILQKCGLKKYRVKEILPELITGQFISRQRKDVTSPYLYYRYYWA